MDALSLPACPPAAARLLGLLAYQAPLPEDAAAWSDDDWDAIVEVAGRHGLSPLLYRRLGQGDLSTPEAVVTRLRRGYLRVAADNTRRLAALEEALLALEREAVPAILLKGAHLAPLVYGNVALRPMVDLDLLVRDEDVERALQVLATLGYSPLPGEAWMQDRFGHHGLRRDDGLLLELHQRVGAFAVGTRIDQAGIWRRAQRVSVGQASALTLDATDLVLHLCAHAASHHLLQLGLLPLYDVLQALTRVGDALDGEELARRAQAWRISRAVYLVLSLADRLLRAPVDPALLHALAPPDASERVAAAIKALLSDSDRVNVPSGNLVALWAERGWRARARVLWTVILPDAARMRSLYGLGPGDPVGPRLYLRRWADLLTRRGTSVRRLVGRAGDEFDWQALVRWLAQG